MPVFTGLPSPPGDRPSRRGLLAGLLALWLVFIAGAALAAPLGPAALRQRQAELLQAGGAGREAGLLRIESREGPGRIEGEVYAVLSQPFAAVARSLGEPAAWCEVMILHLNNKFCRSASQGGVTAIDLRVGQKAEQPVDAATLMRFYWQPAVVQPDYLRAELGAPEGSYGTRDYRLTLEAVPSGDGRSFLRMGFSFGYGGLGHLALNLYLSTAARNRVGFTPDPRGPDGLVPGLRGLVERNAMRYHLAISAYLESLSAPPAEQVERRLRAWFDATEKYPRQLHEMDREDYLRMKRAEIRRQQAMP